MGWEDERFRVVEQPRVFRSGDRSWKPQCPNTGCKEPATHEIKRGPRFVSRHCEPHAYEECDRLNAEAA